MCENRVFLDFFARGKVSYFSFFFSRVRGESRRGCIFALCRRMKQLAPEENIFLVFFGRIFFYFSSGESTRVRKKILGVSVVIRAERSVAWNEEKFDDACAFAVRSEIKSGAFKFPVKFRLFFFRACLN